MRHVNVRDPTPWVLGGVLVATGVGLAVAVRKHGEPACRPSVAPGSRVLLVGDSLAVGLGPPLRSAFTRAGADFLALAKSGTTMTYWIAGAPRASVEAALGSFSPTLVLVSLGTNDSYGARSDEQLRSDVAAVHALATSRGAEMAWILPPSLPKPDRVGPLVRQAGLHGFESSRLPLRQADGIHPSGRGYAGWAEHVFAWLSCQPEPSVALSGAALASLRRRPQVSFLRPARLPSVAGPAPLFGLGVLGAKRKRARRFLVWKGSRRA
jgi:lysophospholipase L1-like esterase